MGNELLKILIVDDDIDITEKLKNYLSKNKYEPIAVNSSKDALKIIKKDDIDLCILDVVLPVINGIDLLKKMKTFSPNLEVILISGFGTIDTVIEGMRQGAVDFIKKPFNFVDVDFAIMRTKRYLDIQHRLQLTEDKYSLLTRELEKSIERKVIGISPQIKKVLELAVLAGRDNDINVLITGENGTGKEIVARIIHNSSQRRSQHFTAVNSAATPESLLESEFFGHCKGAFTDARVDRKGYFELANRGTLFLDEIAEMPMTLQSKLLRALEEKKIKPVGGTKFIEVDIRIICATNKDLEKLIHDNKFRRDLYHRINTFEINIAPLRERPEDIEPLLRYFVEYFAKKKNRPIPSIDEEVIKRLEKYSFPGNVRELQNMVERAFLISNKKIIEISDFPHDIYEEKDPAKNISLSLEENEKKLIRIALGKANYNQNNASRLLNISRDALIRRMRKYDIQIGKRFK